MKNGQQKTFEIQLNEDDFKPLSAIKNWPSDSADIDVEVTAELAVSDESFDHEFGTEHAEDYEVMIESIMFGDQDLTKLMTEKAMNDLKESLLSKWS